MQVHYDEGIASHIGPESCAGGREAVREALTGDHTGQPSSRERTSSRMPTPSFQRKATRPDTPTRVPDRSGVVTDPGMYGRSLYHGNREISGSTTGGKPLLVRVGKAPLRKVGSRSP